MIKKEKSIKVKLIGIVKIKGRKTLREKSSSNKILKINMKIAGAKSSSDAFIWAGVIKKTETKININE